MKGHRLGVSKKEKKGSKRPEGNERGHPKKNNNGGEKRRGQGGDRLGTRKQKTSTNKVCKRRKRAQRVGGNPKSQTVEKKSDGVQNNEIPEETLSIRFGAPKDKAQSPPQKEPCRKNACGRCRGDKKFEEEKVGKGSIFKTKGKPDGPGKKTTRGGRDRNKRKQTVLEGE